MAQKDILLRIDRNGTKYWGNTTCQRCGGAGASEAWRFTGCTCWECGGTGISKMRIWKEYTPEHRAKLDAARAKRDEKKRQERLAELKSHMTEVYAKHGFGADGKAYAVTEKDSYSIREELKAAGARWMSEFGAWVFKTKPEAYQTVEIAFEEAYTINETYGTVYWNNEVDGRELVKSKTPKTTGIAYIGEVGTKVEVEATFLNGYEYESTYGWRTTTTLIATFETEDGNKLVWKTSTAFKRTDGAFAFPDKTSETGWRRVERGTKMHLTGTVKEHSEFRGEKQTVLTRAKVSIE